MPTLRPPRLIPERAAGVRRFGAYVASEWSVEITPVWRSTTRAVPFVWCHGFQLLGSAGLTARAYPYWPQLSKIAHAAGCVILSADLGGSATWANDTAIARIDTLISWAASNLGTRTDRVFIGGESMGSLLALNWAWRNPVKVAGIWVRAPITRMREFHDLNPGGLAATMEAAYTNLAGLIAAYPTHDPAQNMGALGGLGYKTRLDATASDELIVSTAPILYQRQTGCHLEMRPGTHGDNLYGPWDEIAEWVAATIAANA